MRGRKRGRCGWDQVWIGVNEVYGQRIRIEGREAAGGCMRERSVEKSVWSG